ncbi:HNH endonuclease [Flavobacterium sp. Sr18]|uniref:HNH endonuclease n=1 Tax=Flavobacterium sp. Sr18 TaxID=935222 RepID=UPI0013E4AA37|nr:HNH endonuclease [Flavobacterium sp. Sr18]QIH37938.1 HNH endonuclease [Flavobacterium sp. Sr18]
MNCIFCDKPNIAKSIEHIVSESFGNKDYVMERSSVCDECNSKFSKFEDKALSNSIFVFERARLGIVTKKGKNVKGQVKNIKVEGHQDFKKQHISIQGINSSNFKNFDPKTKTGQLYVESFDKSEESACKLALKIALESIFTSRKKEIFNNYDFTELKGYLTNENTKSWPFIMSDYEPAKFTSIPKMTVKHNLKKNRIELTFLEIDEKTLLFKFTFAAVSITVNLLSRNFKWSEIFIDKDKRIQIYPKHFRKKI